MTSVLDSWVEWTSGYENWKCCSYMYIMSRSQGEYEMELPFGTVICSSYKYSWVTAAVNEPWPMEVCNSNISLNYAGESAQIMKCSQRFIRCDIFNYKLANIFIVEQLPVYSQ